jgi:streptogramin lyase
MCKSRVTEFPVPADFGPPVRITTGPDNNLWFTGRDKVGRMTTTGGAVAFDLVTGAAPFGITAGPDGNIWFSEGAGYIGRMTANGASYVRFPMPTSAFVDAITVGVDGNLWVSSGQKIGVCTPSGSITERNPPMAADVHTIARGPGGTMWFIETGATPQLVRIASTGTMTEYAMPAEFTNPQSLVAGPDGNMWFTGGVRIGRFNITQGSFAGFLVETNTGPNQIAVGSDGNLWATVQTSNDASLLRIVTDGSMTRFPLPAVPDGLTGGPDGNIWFTEPGFGSPGQIARFLIP